MKFWWVIGAVFLLGSIVAGVVGYRYYQALFSPNIQKSESAIVFIYPETNIDSLHDSLEDHLNNLASFKRASEVMDFGIDDLKVGRYEIHSVTTNRELINLFRAGTEAPVNVIIHNERDINLISGKLSQYLLLDSIDILECLTTSSVLKEEGFIHDSLLTLFLPNTYQMYWSTTCDQLANRLIREYDTFWSQNSRREKAKNMDLSPGEVYTLASIVDRETIAPREKPIIAKLYLNRLKIGMPLQADPTIVFANKIFDTRRVLFKHLEMDSPYNTYLYAGLPPGPIGIASISGIDAVLNPDDNKYLYMVAKPDNSGLHHFSTNLRQHNRYARLYQQWLNQRGL